MNRNSFFACVALVSLVACEFGDSELELIDKAKVLLDQQDTKGAVIHLKNALDKNPQSAQARLLLGRALLQNGDPLNALIELQKALQAQAPREQLIPEIARAQLAAGESSKVITQHAEVVLSDAGAAADLKTTLATAYAIQGNLEQARVAAAGALQAQPGHGAATVLLARLDAAQGDFDGALRQLDSVLARDGGHEGAGLLKGEILLRAKNEPDAALEIFRKVRTAHPKSVAAHTAVVDTLVQRNRVGEARTEFEPLQKLAPRHPETLFLQAQFAFADKDFKSSLEITGRLLAAVPNNVRGLLLAGASEYRLHHHALAEGHLERALKLAPNLPPVRHLLAQTYLRTAMPEKALAVLQPLVDGPKADVTSLALTGEAYLQLGDSKRSDAAFQRALKAAPDDAKLRTSLAVSQLGRGETGPALAQLEAIAKTDASTHADLALVSARLRQNDLKGALLAIDGLDKKLPDQAFPLTLRGRVLLQQGDAAGAAASFERALIKEPKYFPATSSLAGLDLSAGKPELARQRYRALIEADPNDFRPRLALAELDSRLGVPDPVVAAQLREAAKADPTQVEPHLALIGRLLASGDNQGALVAAQDASAVLPNDLSVMDALGRAQLAAREAQRAVSTFKKLASLQPKNPLHQVRLAEAFLAGKDIAAATQALQKALAIQPYNQMAERGLALLAMVDKRPKDGIAIARGMQQRSPQDAVGFALEGEIEASMKNWPAAAAAYRAALVRNKSTALAVKLHSSLLAAKGPDADRMAADWQKDNPKDAAFIFYLGDRSSAAKDWAKAEVQYRAVLALQPRNAMAMNNIAWLMATQRKPGALALAEQANTLLPERAGLLDTLALAQEAENLPAEALATQKRAVELDPKDPALRLHLARIYLNQGDKASARLELESLARLGAKFAGQAEVAELLKSLG